MFPASTTNSKTSAYDMSGEGHNCIMGDLEKKRLQVDEAFSRWYPAGINLIKQLNKSADELDRNQKGTSVAGLLGGVTSFVGAAMTLFPPTVPFGIAIGLTGIYQVKILLEVLINSTCKCT